MNLPITFLPTLPSIVFLLLLPYHIWTLSKGTVKIVPGHHRSYTKQVCYSRLVIYREIRIAQLILSRSFLSSFWPLPNSAFALGHYPILLSLHLRQWLPFYR